MEFERERERGGGHDSCLALLHWIFDYWRAPDIYIHVHKYKRPFFSLLASQQSILLLLLPSVFFSFSNWREEIFSSFCCTWNWIRSQEWSLFILFFSQLNTSERHKSRVFFLYILSFGRDGLFSTLSLPFCDAAAVLLLVLSWIRCNGILIREPKKKKSLQCSQRL